MRELPMPGNVLQTVVQLDAYDGPSGRFDTSDADDAQVTTSMVEMRANVHRPVLDIDVPAQLIPSSTPGHFHLYLDVEVEHEAYMGLLDALATVGILEPGYVSASKERGYTAVRLPWVKKVDPLPPMLIDELAAASQPREPF